MDVATDIRERLVRLEVEGDHRKEKLDDLARMVGTHADESREYRVRHDARHAAQDNALAGIAAKLDALTRRHADAEDTGSVLAEGVEAAGASAVKVLSALPAPAWYLLAAAVLGALGLGGAVRPLVDAAVLPVVAPEPVASEPMLFDRPPDDAP